MKGQTIELTNEAAGIYGTINQFEDVQRNYLCALCKAYGQDAGLKKFDEAAPALEAVQNLMANELIRILMDNRPAEQ